MAENRTINQIRFADGNTFNLEGTKYTAGSGIDVNNENHVISLAEIVPSIAAGQYGPTQNLTPSFGDEIQFVPGLSIDTYGRINTATNYTVTIPPLSAGNGLTMSPSGEMSLDNLPTEGGEPWDTDGSPAGPHDSATGAAMNKRTYEDGLDVHIPYVSWDENGITDVEDKTHLINSLPVLYYSVPSSTVSANGIRLLFGTTPAPSAGDINDQGLAGQCFNAIYLQVESQSL